MLDGISRQGGLPAIRMKETDRKAIRHPSRKASKEAFLCHGQKRTLIEGLFGNIKAKHLSHVNVFLESLAQRFALLRFALYNMYLLVSLQR